MKYRGRAGGLAGLIGLIGLVGPIGRVGLSLVAIALGCSPGNADSEAGKGPAPSPILAEQGARDYARYCASCHGVGGRGDGVAAAALRTPPADLTQIAARRGGVFPSGEVRYHIDGRFEHPAHGTREMPIWGVRLGEELDETEIRDEIVRGRLYALVDYLQSIQDPPPREVQ